MLKGITKSGFEYEVEDKALDSWELLESLVEVDEGNVGAIVKVVRQLLDKRQLDKLKNHCKDPDTGCVSKNKMFIELADILGGKGSESEKQKNV